MALMKTRAGRMKRLMKYKRQKRAQGQRLAQKARRWPRLRLSTEKMRWLKLKLSLMLKVVRKIESHPEKTLRLKKVGEKKLMRRVTKRMSKSQVSQKLRRWRATIRKLSWKILREARKTKMPMKQMRRTSTKKRLLMQLSVSSSEQLSS